ncbi:MAG: hypothetical protein RLZZ303_625 [Candidatus Hydrogenedentota bacterium]|jgi:probable rRNA maturation factor
MVRLGMRSESTRKQLYRRDDLQRLADRIAEGESVREACEVSVLFVDDEQMRAINRAYRKVNKPTDVLSFEQPEGPAGETRLLGDIVMSLETVEQRWPGEPAKMRDEVRLLLCHGMLHLLGYDHDTAQARKQMIALQARYLGRTLDAAWFAPPHARKGRTGKLSAP